MGLDLFRRVPAPGAARPALALEHGAVPWVLATALAAAAPHGGRLPSWLSLLAGLVLLWRGWLWLQNGRLPARWLLVLLAIGGVVEIGLHYGTLFGRDPGVAILFFFVALKPMEMQARRDALVVVLLGFFLLLTHYFYFQGIATGAWMLAVSALLTATLIRLHSSGQSAVRVLRHAGLLIAQALPFALIFFLLFPRVSVPLWGLPQDAHAGRTGISDHMSPGSINSLIQSEAIAFRARFSATPPEKSRLYWRGPAFDDYDGQTWRAHPANEGNTPAAPDIAAQGQTIRYVIIPEPRDQRWLLALDLPVGLPEDSRLAPTLEVLSAGPLLARAQFGFASVLDYAANRSESPQLLRRALQLPSGLNPRTRQLAAEWQSRFGTPERISAAALDFFGEQDFFYTLRPPLLGRNAVDDFLFDSRRGFCEHYAGAYVVLMRAAGVPARVVTGYQGGDINPVDGHLTVRQSDAHAWAEIWTENRGWVRVDPTAAVAPSRIEQGLEAALAADEPLSAFARLDSGWLRALRHGWEAADSAWNQWIIGYNPQRQRETLSLLGMGDSDWRSMVAALAALSGLALLVVAAWAVHQRTAITPVQRAWHRYCRRLERQGVRREAWEGPFDFAARVARERHELGALTREAAGHFADLRYGTGKAAQLQQLKDCTRRLPSHRRKNV